MLQNSLNQFWKSSGAVNYKNESEILSITKEIPTDEELKTSYLQFVDNHDKVKYNFCAACGIRDPNLSYANRNVTNLNILRCKDNVKHYETTCVFDNNCYYLHKVSQDGNCTLCEKCDLNIRRKKLPYFSIANGIELGSKVAKTLPNLNVLEKLLISQSVIYNKVLKYNCSGKIGSSLITGHVISIPHAKSLDLINMLPRLCLKNIVQLIFISEPGSLYKLHQKFVLDNQINYNNVFKWLKFLKENNPLYRDTIIRCDYNPLILQELIQSSIFTNDQLSINLESCNLDNSKSINTLGTVNNVLLHDQNTSNILTIYFGRLLNEYEDLNLIWSLNFPWLFPIPSRITNSFCGKKSTVSFLLRQYDNRCSYLTVGIQETLCLYFTTILCYKEEWPPDK